MGIVEVFGMICLTSLTGSFYFLCWLLVERILDRSGLIEENLIFLYMGLFFFTVPVLYAILRMMAMEADGAIVGTFLTPTPFILNLVRKIGWIWLAGMCISIVYYGGGLFLQRQYWKNSRPCEQWIEQKLDVCASRLGLSLEHVRVRWNPSLGQPHVQGFRKFVILLPDPRRYTESEVEKMLFHELTHCRSRDTRMKHYLALLECIYWWNPIYHWMNRETGKWMEARCDDRVWKQVPEMDIKGYYQLLVKLTEQKKITIGLTTGFWEKKSYLKARIQRIERNRAMAKKGQIKKKKILASTVAMLMILTTTTVWAAGEAVQAGYEQLYQNTDIAVQEECAEDSQVEYIEPMDANPAVRVVDAPGSDISLQASSASFDWNVDANTLIRSASFSAQAGDKITVSASVSPGNVSVKVGIITPNERKRYVLITGDGSHVFSINESGTYRIFAENTSKTSVHVEGFYGVY